MRKLPNWNISIQIAENGVSVQVGCKTFVSEDIDKAMAEVTSFIKDKKTEFSKKYLLEAREAREVEPACDVAAPPQLQSR
jgi:hypothetical protein